MANMLVPLVIPSHRLRSVALEHTKYTGGTVRAQLRPTEIGEAGCTIKRVMQENKKKWMELCEQPADEQDPKRLAALILRINFILETKELRLTGKLPATQPPVADRLT